MNKIKRHAKTCTIAYVIGRWNPNNLRVEYLNTRGDWVLNLSPFTAKFGTEWINSALLEQATDKHYQVFACKVFNNIKERMLTLTKPNHWHKMEAMMKI